MVFIYIYTRLYLPYKSTKCSYIIVEVDFGGVTNWDDLPSRSKTLNKNSTSLQISEVQTAVS